MGVKKELRNYHTYSISFEFAASSATAKKIEMAFIKLLEKFNLNNATITHNETIDTYCDDSDVGASDE